jgi:hypothetical protein
MLYPRRCQHLKINGAQCDSPALHRRRFCFFHNRIQEETLKLARDRRRRAGTIFLPVLEDANSIQVALMQVMRLLVTQQIDHPTARLLLQALRLATTNLKELRLEIYREEHIVDTREVVNSRIGKHLWYEEECEEEEYEDDEEESEEDDEETEEDDGDEEQSEAETAAPAKPAPAAVTPATQPPRRPVSSAQQVRAEIVKMIRGQMSGYGPFPKITPPKR